MKQKIVIKVSMNDAKCRKKAMKTVVGHSGVQSVALKGEDKNQIEVVGDGMDAAELTKLLRKKVGHAEIVSVSPDGDKKDDDKKDPKVIWSANPFVYSAPLPYNFCEVRDPSYDNCTIM